jgi:RimJ/RimL family protein N-acetyltransferase
VAPFSFGGKIIELQPMADADFAWLLGEQPVPAGAPRLPEGGIAPPEVYTLIRGIAAELRDRTAGDVAWLMVINREAVGMISFTKIGDDGVPEIGYGVAPQRQGRGHASAAVKALMPVVESAGFAGLAAENSVDNPTSQRVLERNGFQRIGERDDPEDGRVVQWAIGWGS